MATPVRFGSEFLLNTITTGPQQELALAALVDGRFVAVWTDQSGTDDVSSAGIRAQVFNADGAVAELSFQVNMTTAANQNQPAITALSNGRFVVTWTDQSASGDDTSQEAIRGQIYNTNGSMFGSEFVVNTTTAFDQRDSTITALAAGRFVVCWNDPADGTSGRGIRAQIFNADGSKSGLEFVVNSTKVAEQSDPSVTSLANGGFVACWMDFSSTGSPGGDPSGRAIRAQVFDANGTALGNLPDFVVNSTTAGDQFEPSVTALANGGFVVTWTDGALAGGNSSVRAQVYDATGTRSGSEILVNTTLAGNQHDSSVAALADGRFVVSWVDFSATGGDTSGSAIRAQVFNLDGSKSGGEFLVNTIVTGNQGAPAISTLADGRFIVSWTDSSNTLGTVSAQDIRGQMFDPREAAVRLSGTALADQWVGTKFNDRMTGAGGNDILRGESGADILNGGNGNDQLFGGNGSDQLIAGLGRDRISGQGAADDFIFASADQAGMGNKCDQITDFEHLVDDLDFSSFMAGGSFIGNADFSQVAGQVRYSRATGILQGDVGGDGNVDFEIFMSSKPVLTAADFMF